MPDIEQACAEKQAMRFLLLYALASAGGAVAYVPFLTIVLPSYVTSIAGKEDLSLLAYITFAGAIAASVSNIIFGWASDVMGSRRPLIVSGLCVSCLLITQVRTYHDPDHLIGFIVLWQICLNMMLSPLSAWAGDCVPDTQKGLLGGLLAFTPALGAMSGILITWGEIVKPEHQLIWIAGLTVLCVMPVLLFGRPLNIQQLNAPLNIGSAPSPQAQRPVLMAKRMWTARLLIQIAEASLFAFLLLWFRSIDPGFEENRIATIFTAVMACAVIVALLIGHWSDRYDRPIPPLIFSALAVALGLLVMASVKSIAMAILGYALFAMAGSVFLALHSSQTLRVLQSPKHRGRDLGLFNLTNTMPSMVMPWLTLAIVPVYGFGALFTLLCLLALGAAILLWRKPKI
jgi:MFS family permease